MLQVPEPVNKFSAPSRAVNPDATTSNMVPRSRVAEGVAIVLMISGPQLRAARHLLGHRMTDVAAAAWQVTLRTYRKYEAGAPQRSIGPLLCFADPHDVSIDWLICGDPACLKRHLTSRAEGKVAILGARWRGA